MNKEIPFALREFSEKQKKQLTKKLKEEKELQELYLSFYIHDEEKTNKKLIKAENKIAKLKKDLEWNRLGQVSTQNNIDYYTQEIKKQEATPNER